MQDRGAKNSQKLQVYCKLYTPVLHVCINPYLTNPLRHLLFPISLVVVMDSVGLKVLHVWGYGKVTPLFEPHFFENEGKVY